MKIIKCPNCSNDTYLDERKSFGFCSYCGTKIQINNKIFIDNPTPPNFVTVNALLQKGFMHLDNQQIDDAKRTFEQAMMFEPQNIYTLIGMMFSQDVNNMMPINSVYYRRVLAYSQYISLEEKSIINEYNCDQIVKTYMCCNDKNRVNYMIERFPNTTFKLFEESIVRSSYLRNIDIIETLITNNIRSIDFIFNKIFDGALSSTSTKKEFRTDILPIFLLEKMFCLGLSNKQIVYFPAVYYDDDNFQRIKRIKMDLYNFFSQFTKTPNNSCIYPYSRGYCTFVNIDFTQKSTPEDYMKLLIKYGYKPQQNIS